MNRKGHLSTKIHNVKLRPAPAQKKSTTSSSSEQKNYYERTEQGSGAQPGSGDLQESGKPFTGVILCATGVQHKGALFKMADELGATCIGDFTEAVTHLIAAEPGSAKYQCALERNIPIMHPSWISDALDKWQKYEDFTLDEMQAKHRLPTFIGCRVCLTLEDDVPERTKLGKLVSTNGGKYCKNLDDRITHLVVCHESDDESAKLQAARRMNAQRLKTTGHEATLIKIVWSEWLLDCADWKGRWDESTYSIDKERPQRKKPQAAPLLEPPSFDSCSTSTQKWLQGVAGPSKRILASSSRTPSEMVLMLDGKDESEEAIVRRGQVVGGVKSVLDQQLWTEILSQTTVVAAEVKGKKPIRNAKAGEETEDEDEIPDSQRRLKSTTASPRKPEESTIKRPSLMPARAMTRTKSFAVPQVPFKKRDATPLVTVQEELGKPGPSTSSPQVFAGLRIRTLGDANADVLHNMLKKYGATAIRSQPTELLDDADFVVVRLSQSTVFFDDKHPIYSKLRTECWVEYCVWEERLCQPHEHPSYTPLKIPLPVSGADAVRIIYSGLLEDQVSSCRKFCKALGFTNLDKFTNQVTHLICPTKSGVKYDKALKMGIEVVDLDWLWRVGRTGSLDSAASSPSSEKQPMGDVTNDSPDDETQPEEPSDKAPRPFLKARPGLPHKSASTPTRPNIPPATSPPQAKTPFKSPTGLQKSKLFRNTTAPISPSKRGSATPEVSLAASTTNPNLSLNSSIVALLGKRNTEDSESEAVPIPPKKRTRPTSRAKTVMESARNSVSVSPARASPAFVPLPPPPIGTYNETAYDDQSMDPGPDSIQVVYEDPAQSAEKAKLLALIEGEAPPAPKVEQGPSKRKSLPRKSKAGRVPGF